MTRFSCVPFVLGRCGSPQRTFVVRSAGRRQRRRRSGVEIALGIDREASEIVVVAPAPKAIRFGRRRVGRTASGRNRRWCWFGGSPSRRVEIAFVVDREIASPKGQRTRNTVSSLLSSLGNSSFLGCRFSRSDVVQVALTVDVEQSLLQGRSTGNQRIVGLALLLLPVEGNLN